MEQKMGNISGTEFITKNAAHHGICCTCVGSREFQASTRHRRKSVYRYLETGIVIQAKDVVSIKYSPILTTTWFEASRPHRSSSIRAENSVDWCRWRHIEPYRSTLLGCDPINFPPILEVGPAKAIDNIPQAISFFHEARYITWAPLLAHYMASRRRAPQDFAPLGVFNHGYSKCTPCRYAIARTSYDASIVDRQKSRNAPNSQSSDIHIEIDAASL
ncbi:uncharacterized protein F5891DRAFT_1171317 [Suillus fuscotomentosus]|uniref:Uncharacterized protein n=1 Tax=Suillus fuscotomentosus TaxID=1912939 RepID=A0AAD4HP80_9AGAM|nr:uncharacterized protein F5891DRAFT_1171317 [Suillus fuscotomentosus]KAG1903536.1 hypothetical protein F5891DRAFT_1171317 [Suillus fuscotomentosus]